MYADHEPIQVSMSRNFYDHELHYFCMCKESKCMVCTHAWRKLVKINSNTVNIKFCSTKAS